jgi:hypothetical protein
MFPLWWSRGHYLLSSDTEALPPGSHRHVPEPEKQITKDCIQTATSWIKSHYNKLDLSIAMGNTNLHQKLNKS